MREWFRENREFVAFAANLVFGGGVFGGLVGVFGGVLVVIGVAVGVLSGVLVVIDNPDNCEKIVAGLKALRRRRSTRAAAIPGQKLGFLLLCLLIGGDNAGPVVGDVKAELVEMEEAGVGQRERTRYLWGQVFEEVWGLGVRVRYWPVKVWESIVGR